MLLMTSPKGPRPPRPTAARAKQFKRPEKELVIVTGISGAGKASALKAFEDLGYHAVDNLPLELLPEFAELVGKSDELKQAVIVVDVVIPALSVAEMGRSTTVSSGVVCVPGLVTTMRSFAIQGNVAELCEPFWSVRTTPIEGRVTVPTTVRG